MLPTLPAPQLRSQRCCQLPAEQGDHSTDPQCWRLTEHYLLSLGSQEVGGWQDKGQENTAQPLDKNCNTGNSVTQQRPGLRCLPR